MSAPVANLREQIEVQMSRGEALGVARLIRKAWRKAARELESSTFIPEPGHRHAAEVAVERWGKLLDKYCAACGVTPADLEDGGTPRRRQQ